MDLKYILDFKENKEKLWKGVNEVRKRGESEGSDYERLDRCISIIDWLLRIFSTRGLECSG